LAFGDWLIAGGTLSEFEQKAEWSAIPIRPQNIKTNFSATL
jgi:hypothetical protein